MKVALLAGGYGTRISEESSLRPKPMVEIGEKPILWHIMKYYSHFGFNEFVILLGYKGYLIKEYFSNYFLHQCDVTIETVGNKFEIHNDCTEDWKISLVETGLDTLTGGRIKRAQKYLEDDAFMLTYGDGLANINLPALLEFHKSHGKIATLTSVQPEARFGAIEFGENDRIEHFIEKPKGDGAWINGGFFVFQPEIFDYIKQGDETILERQPLEDLTRDNQLYAYRHKGFWQCMDTIRDKQKLTHLWETGEAQWKVW